jgi:hypothetical protein
VAGVDLPASPLQLDADGGKERQPFIVGQPILEERQPIRQWVLSLPIALRYLLATRPEVVTQVLGIVYRAISGHL